MLALPHLLAICLSSLWSSPSPPHALALIFLSLVEVQLLPILTISSLIIWCSGLMALFLHLLAKAALAYSPTALSVALRQLFPFWQAQYVQVSLLKPVPFCKLFAGLSSTKSATSPILLSFCPCHLVLSPIFPFTSNSLEDVAGTVFSLLLFYKATMCP